METGERLWLPGVLLEVLPVLSLLALPQLHGKLQLQGRGQGGQHCRVQLIQPLWQNCLQGSMIWMSEGKVRVLVTSTKEEGAEQVDSSAGSSSAKISSKCHLSMTTSTSGWQVKACDISPNAYGISVTSTACHTFTLWCRLQKWTDWLRSNASVAQQCYHHRTSATVTTHDQHTRKQKQPNMKDNFKLGDSSHTPLLLLHWTRSPPWGQHLGQMWLAPRAWAAASSPLDSASLWQRL